MVKIIKMVLHCIVRADDLDREREFEKQVAKLMYGAHDSRAQLAEHVLDSIVEFYKILTNDQTRDGIVGRKLILQAIAGGKVRESGENGLLAETIGARRMTLDLENINRTKLEEHQKLLPFKEILKRKSARGSRFISEKEKLEVLDFYENDDVSDILKGHNNIYKELLTSEEGNKSVFNRSKRVLKLNSCDLLGAAQKQLGLNSV